MTEPTAVLLATLFAGRPVLGPFAGRVDAYAEHVDRCATELSLRPAEVLAVILKESGGDPEAYNARTGATGLMQVIPRDTPVATWQGTFAGRPTSHKLRDPAVNIAWGCGILADRLRRHGSLKMALFHYSGGIHWAPDEGTPEARFERALARFEREYYDRYETFLVAMMSAWAGHGKEAESD